MLVMFVKNFIFDNIKMDVIYLLLAIVILIFVLCRQQRKERFKECPDALAVFSGQNQAFCANTWCQPGPDNRSMCDCPIFNNYGLAPLSSLMKYKDDPDIIVSTYDILQGVQQPKPKMCFGKYIDCYGKACCSNSDDQSVVRCHCQVKEGPFLTASSSCGPDEMGRLPNGAAIAQDQGIATANSIIKIMETAKNK